jgi:hypothetical protein
MGWAKVRVSHFLKVALGLRDKRFPRVSPFLLTLTIGASQFLKPALGPRLRLDRPLMAPLKALLTTHPLIAILGPSSTLTSLAHAVPSALLTLLRVSLGTRVLDRLVCRSVRADVDPEVKRLEVVVQVGFERM